MGIETPNWRKEKSLLKGFLKINLLFLSRGVLKFKASNLGLAFIEISLKIIKEIFDFAYI